MVHYPKLSLDTAPRAMILVNGEFPRGELPLALLGRWREAPEEYPLICCDGAVNKLSTYSPLLPTAVVGDLDSVSPMQRARLQGRIHSFPDQNSNDLTKAITFASTTLGYRRLILLGASGGRDDHYFSNIALLISYASLVDELIMLSDTGYFRLFCGEISIQTEIGQQISLFNFDASPITAKGLRWPLDRAILPALWMGSLNRAEVERIELSCPSPMLVFLANECKG